MTADNRRKEEESKAQAENSEESPVHFPNGAIADQAGTEQSFLPSSRDNIYIAKIENVLNDWSMQEAIAAVKRKNNGSCVKPNP